MLKSKSKWLMWENIGTLIILFVIGNDLLALTGVGLPLLLDDFLAILIMIDKFQKWKKKSKKKKRRLKE